MRRLPGGLVVTVPAQVLLVLALAVVVRWPFGVWAEAVRRDEGLSVRSWTGFVRDRLLAAGMEAGLLAVALLVVVLLARRWPRWWPALAAAGGAALVVLLSLLYPVVVEPVFAEHTPLPDGPLRQQVEALADRAGTPVRDVLVADTSTRSTTLNASVSGLGPTRRVVLQDTLLAAMAPEEVVAVVAHEVGHAAEDDVVRGTALGALGTASLVLLLGTGALAWQAQAVRRGRAAGPVGAVGGAAAAGALVLVVTLVQVVATPVESLVSRQVERTADISAVTLTGDPLAWQQAVQTLLVTNRSDPSPPGWAQWWFGSHPTGAERVARAGG